MIYDYNLILALPTGDHDARQKISGDVRYVEESVRKHQKWTQATITTDEESGREFGDLPELIEGGEVMSLRITPEVLKKGIKQDWIDCFKELNRAEKSRLVLFAHGCISGTRVAERVGDEMGILLVDTFKLKKVTRISVLACMGGGNPADPRSVSLKSFAQVFHKWLGRKRNIFTEVTARTKWLNSSKVHGEKGRRLAWVPSEEGALPSSGKGEWKYRAPDTKYLWYWDNGQQMVKLVY